MYKSHLRLIMDKKYFGNQSIKKKFLKNYKKSFFLFFLVLKNLDLKKNYPLISKIL